VVSLLLEDVVRVSNRASQSWNGTMGTPRVWATLLKMCRHEIGFGCAMWMMLDDVSRISAIAEPATSRGTQLASWIITVSVLPIHQGRDRVQLESPEGT